MNQEEIPYEKVMAVADRLTKVALKDMFGPDNANTVFLMGDLDGLSSDEIFEALEKVQTPIIAVTGDWRKSTKIDIYDVILMFAEERYSRLRSKKHPSGMYIVVMGDPLEDFQKNEAN